MISFIPLCAFSLIMLWAAQSDLAQLKIPNIIPTLLVVTFLVSTVLLRVPYDVMFIHIGVGCLLFTVGFFLFLTGKFGGGDAKLLAAGALWFGWGVPLIYYLYFIVIVGGGLSILLLVFRHFPLPLFLAKQDWAAELYHKNNGVPYAVPIALGSLWAYPHSVFYTGF